MEAFDYLKDKLKSHPVLRIVDWNKPSFITTDASKFSLGAVLEQEFDGKHANSQCSRKLKPSEVNYSTIQKEAIVCVFGVTYFKYYLTGHKFTLITGHAPLRYMMQMKHHNAILSRWCLELQSYDFETVYKPGNTNCADGFSHGF